MKAKKTADSVFGDLGFDRETAEHLRIRADLMIAVEQFIQREGLTQEEAAERLDVTQPRISDLVRGKIDRFSIDTLVNMLSRAGVRVSIDCIAA